MLQETTRFRLATGPRKKYSQTIHVNTVGEPFSCLHFSCPRKHQLLFWGASKAPHVTKVHLGAR